MNISDSPPLVAHVVHRFGVGGLENGIVNLVNRLPRERWRHVVIALTDVAPAFAERIERDDVRLIALDKRPGHLARDYPRLFLLFRELRPAIVHTRNLAALEAIVPARAAGVPVRIHGEHGWDMHDPQGRRARYRVVRRLYRPFVTRYVALSRHLERYLTLRIGIPAERVSQIYNGVDTDRFRPASMPREAIPGCPFRDDAAHWLVGTVGRMEAVKDPLNLVRAFIDAVERDPAGTRDLRLIMVGDGALRPDIVTMLEAHRMHERVWLPGERGDVDVIMRGLDCFVLPSLAEGVSNTIIEAMSSGLAIVATDVGGNGELIESAGTGTLVPAQDSSALARAMLGYHRDRAMVRQHGQAARQVAERRFTLDRMTADYAALYERALAGTEVLRPNADAQRSAARTVRTNAPAHPANQLTDSRR